MTAARTPGTGGRRTDLRALGSRLAMLVWLVLVWVLLWGYRDPGTVLAGVLVALATTLLLPLPRVPVEGLVHPLSALRLGATVAWYLVSSSLHVAWLSVRPAAPPESAVLRAPMRLRSDFLLALAVNALNLVPGGLVVRIDPVRRDVYVHVLDAGTERARESFYRQVASIERLFVRAFERPGDWRPSPLHEEAWPAEDPDATDAPEAADAPDASTAPDPASTPEETR